jgi:anthranilate/para-aminobenzoate synthase component II
MSSLANQQQNLSFPGLLQVPGGITSTLQQVQDGDGNATGLSLSSTGASVTTSSTFQASINGTTLTGATARLISDGFGDLPTVKDFGAVGNGTTDDTAAFTAAIAASPAGVAVPAGSYKITGTVTGAFYSFGTVTVVTGTVTSIQNLTNYLTASNGSTLVGTIQTGTGATARTVAAKVNDIVSVKDFGAVGNGTADDTIAIQAAMDAIPSTGGNLYFPAGTYILTDVVTITDKPITIHGDGMNISVLKWTGVGMTGVNGIEYTATQQRIFTMYDLSLEAVPNLLSAATLAGSAIKLIYPTQLSVYETTIQFQRVYFSPLRTGNTWAPILTGGWTTCVEGIDANYPNFSDCTFLGTGVGTIGVELSSNNNPDYITFGKCNFIGVNTCIKLAGPSSIGGLVVEGCDFLTVGIGIDVAVYADLIQVYGSYFKFSQFGIRSLARNTTVTNNRFDADDNLYTAAEVQGVRISLGIGGPFDANVIANNVFTRNSTAPFDGIVLDSACVGSSIIGNTFGSTIQYGTALRRGAYFMVGSEENRFTDNIEIAVTSLCYDIGTNNMVYNNANLRGIMPITGATPTLTSGQFDLVLGNMVSLTQTSPTNVTNLLNGFTGQEITIVADDSNSTIIANTHFLIGTNFAMTINSSITLKFDGSAWRLVSRFA